MQWPAERPGAIAISSLALGMLGLAYLLAGFAALVLDLEGSYPIDLRLRWIESGFVWQGLNPQVHGHPGLPPSHAAMTTEGGSYPPWSYAIGVVLVPPISFEAVRIYFAALCLLAVGALAAWGFRYAGPLGAAALLAMFPSAICISYGQYTLLCTALIAAALWAHETRHPIVAGLLLGLAAVKPQLVALILLVFLIRRLYATLAAAGSVLVLGTIITSALVSAAPWTMMQNFSREPEMYYWLSQNPLLPWLVPYLGFSPTAALLAASGAAVTTAVAWKERHRESVMTSVAVAVAATMFWSYRKHYDTVAMGLVLVPLLAATVQRRMPALVVLSALLGLSLWWPIRGVAWQTPLVQIGDLIVWPAAAAGLLWAQGWSAPGGAVPAVNRDT